MGLKFVVDGADLSSSVRARTSGFSDPSFELRRNQRGRLTFDLEIETPPAKRDIVTAYEKDGTTAVFGGFIERRDPLPVPYGAPKVWRIEVLDYSRALDWSYWTKSYTTNKTVKQVLTDLVSDKLAANGLSLDAGQPNGPTLTAPFGWTRRKASDVIKDLLESLPGYIMRTSPTGAIKVFLAGSEAGPEALSVSAFNVSEVTSTDSTQVPANAVTSVFGPSGVGESTITHTWTADGVTTAFALTGENVPASSVWPGTILVDAVSYPMWPPGGAPGGNGIEWDYTEDDGTVSFLGTAAALVAGTQPIVLTYYPQFPFRILKTTGASPVIEAEVSFPTITDYPQADLVAAAQLSQADQDPKVWTVDTLVEGFDIGQELELDAPDRGASSISAVVTGVRGVMVSDLYVTYVITAEEVASALQADALTDLRRKIGSSAGSGSVQGTVSVVGAGVSGSGTAGKLAKWLGSDVLTDSIVTESGSALTVAGSVEATAMTIAGAYVYRVGGTDVSMADGGTGASLTAAHGAIPYSTASALALLAPGTSGQVFVSGGAGAPSWNSPAALTKADDTNVTLTLGGSPSIALLAATSLNLGWTGQLAVDRGGTGLASYAVGDLLYASGATTLAKLADVAAGSYLRSGGVTTAPVWSTLVLPNAATSGQIVRATATNTYGGSSSFTFDGSYFNVTGYANIAATVNSAWALTLSNTGSTSAHGLYVNIGASSTGIPFRVDINGAAQFNIANSGAITLTGATTIGSTLTWGSGGTAISSSATVALINAANTFTQKQTVVGSFAGQNSLQIENTSATGFGPYITGGGASHYSIYVADRSGNLQFYAQGGTFFGNAATWTGLQTVTATTEQQRLRYDASNYMSVTVGSDGATTFNAVGAGAAFTFSDQVNIATHLRPTINWTSDLGSQTLKVRKIYAAELEVDTLVAQDVIATIGGEIITAPTTKLTAAISAVATTITVEHNELASGDRIWLEARGQFEMMAVTSGPSGSAGAYTYSVTRDLDGTGANAWIAGDAVVNTGTTGDGYIHQYATGGTFAGTGPAIVGQVRTGTAYNAIAPRWAIGNLDGLYGYSGSTYGAAFGDASNAWLKIDATNGIRIGHNATTKISLTAAGDASFTGSITAASGTIGGWTIDTSAIYSGGNYISLVNGASNASYLRVGDGGTATAGLNAAVSGTDIAIWAGAAHADRATAPFRVDLDGTVTATDGVIGGWTVESSAIYSGGNYIRLVNGASNASYLRVGDGGTATAGVNSAVAGSDISFWAGSAHADRATAAFRVTLAGALVASSATITGTITATGGAVGGFDIGADYVRDAANSFGFASTVSGSDDVRFWAGGTFANRASTSTPLRIYESGAIYASAMYLASTITIESSWGSGISATVSVGSVGFAGITQSWVTSAAYKGNYMAASTAFVLTGYTAWLKGLNGAGSGSFDLIGSEAGPFASNVVVLAPDGDDVRSYGKIGIGTNPTAELDVVGSGAFTGSLAVTTNVTVTNAIVVGSPTGGNKGAGTINAVAVYDDNTLLSDALWDLYYDGRVRVEDLPRWADAQLYTIAGMREFTRANRHLPSMPGRSEWERSTSSVGELVTGLWKTVEYLQMQVFELESRLSHAAA